MILRMTKKSSWGRCATPGGRVMEEVKVKVGTQDYKIKRTRVLESQLRRSLSPNLERVKIMVMME